MKLFNRRTLGVNDYGIFTPKDQCHDIDLNKEIFTSIYYYTEKQVEDAKRIITVKKNDRLYKRPRGVGTITDQSGQVYKTITDVVTDKLFFDFDNNDFEIPRKSSLKLIERLNSHGIPNESIEIWFSGGKGIHIIVNLNSMISPQEHRNICQSLSFDLDGIDTTIYNPSRIFRLPLSKHKSGAYKSPMKFETLKNWDHDRIIEYAKLGEIKPKQILNIWKKIDLPESIVKFMTLKVKTPKKDTENDLIIQRKIEDLDFQKRPSFLSPAKFVLHSGLIPEGKGQDSRMILASTYKNAGFTRGDAYKLLKSVSEKRGMIYGEEFKFDTDELWTNVLESVFSDSWQGGDYGSEHPIIMDIDEKLPNYLKKKDRSGLVKTENIFSKFQKFATDIDKNTLKFGIPDLDKNFKLITGCSVGILGIPGSGKTSLAMELLSHNSRMGEPSLFYSMDMGESLIALKQLQRVSKLSNDEIFNLVKNKNPKYHELCQKAFDEYKNVEYCFKFGVSPADIRNDIDEYEERTGRKIRLVVIDYLESVQSGYSDPTVGSGYVAQQLADIANEKEVVLVILMQTQKSVRPGESIESMRSIKGASVIEQSLSLALGIFRPGQPIRFQSYDSVMGVNVLKNRFGMCSENWVGWRGQSSKIIPMTKDDYLHRQEIEDQKKDEDDEKEEKGRW